MTKIAKFDKKNLALLRPEIDAALVALAEKYGLAIHTGSCSFDPLEASFKLVLKVDDPAAFEEKEKENFVRYCRMIGSGFAPTDFGTRFRVSGAWYVLVGIDMGRSKYCVKAREEATGKIKLYTDAVVPLIRAAADETKKAVAS